MERKKEREREREREIERKRELKKEDRIILILANTEKKCRFE